jgi:hypothetical protein
MINARHHGPKREAECLNNILLQNFVVYLVRSNEAEIVEIINTNSLITYCVFYWVIPLNDLIDH